MNSGILNFAPFLSATLDISDLKYWLADTPPATKTFFIPVFFNAKSVLRAYSSIATY